MKISSVASIQRPISIALLIPLILLLIDAKALAQEKPTQEGKIANARWELVGDVVVVTYDLVANPDLMYEVNITLRREGDKTLKILPRTVSGAVGKGKFAGTKREIRWDYKKDVPQGLYGDDYFFEFEVYAVMEARGTSFLTYAAVVGGIGLLAGAVAMLVGGKKAEESGTPRLPDPPKIRPEQ